MAAYGPGTSWIINKTGDISRRRLEDAARRNAPNWNASGMSARDVLAEQRAGAHNQGEMESRLVTPAYDAAPAVDPAAAAEVGGGDANNASTEMGESEYDKFLNQAFMAAMMKRKDVPFPGGRVAGSVKTAPGPEPMRRAWEKDYRRL
jgi:hypothetical protein